MCECHYSNDFFPINLVIDFLILPLLLLNSLQQQKAIEWIPLSSDDDFLSFLLHEKWNNRKQEINYRAVVLIKFSSRYLMRESTMAFVSSSRSWMTIRWNSKHIHILWAVADCITNKMRSAFEGKKIEYFMPWKCQNESENRKEEDEKVKQWLTYESDS